MSLPFLRRLGAAVDAELGTAHALADPLPVAESWREGGAVRSAALVDALLAAAPDEASPTDAVPPPWRLAVVDAMLVAPEAGRVFGQAAVAGGCAVVGLAGLDGGSRCDDSTLLDRAAKSAVHELGHAAGLGHCADPTCVMYPSRDIADTDRKARGFCRRCRSDLAHATLDAARS